MLNKYGCHYRQARRKGLLTENDLKLRIKFAKDIKKRYGDGVWSSRICFYFDDKHFIHKKIQWIRQKLRKVWSIERKMKA